MRIRLLAYHLGDLAGSGLSNLSPTNDRLNPALMIAGWPRLRLFRLPHPE